MRVVCRPLVLLVLFATFLSGSAHGGTPVGGPLPQDDGESGMDAPDECVPGEPSPIAVGDGVYGELLPVVDRSDVFTFVVGNDRVGEDIRIEVRSALGAYLYEQTAEDLGDHPISFRLVVYDPSCDALDAKAILVSLDGRQDVTFTPEAAGAYQVEVASATPIAFLPSSAERPSEGPSSARGASMCDPCPGAKPYHAAEHQLPKSPMR